MVYGCVCWLVGCGVMCCILCCCDVVLLCRCVMVVVECVCVKMCDCVMCVMCDGDFDDEFFGVGVILNVSDVCDVMMVSVYDSVGSDEGVCGDGDGKFDVVNGM